MSDPHTLQTICVCFSPGSSEALRTVPTEAEEAANIADSAWDAGTASRARAEATAQWLKFHLGWFFF